MMFLNKKVGTVYEKLLYTLTKNYNYKIIRRCTLQYYCSKFYIHLK